MVVETSKSALWGIQGFYFISTYFQKMNKESIKFLTSVIVSVLYSSKKTSCAVTITDCMASPGLTTECVMKRECVFVLDDQLLQLVVGF